MDRPVARNNTSVASGCNSDWSVGQQVFLRAISTQSEDDHQCQHALQKVLAAVAGTYELLACCRPHLTG